MAIAAGVGGDGGGMARRTGRFVVQSTPTTHFVIRDHSTATAVVIGEGEAGTSAVQGNGDRGGRSGGLSADRGRKCGADSAGHRKNRPIFYHVSQHTHQRCESLASPLINLCLAPMTAAAAASCWHQNSPAVGARRLKTFAARFNPQRYVGTNNAATINRSAPRLAKAEYDNDYAYDSNVPSPGKGQAGLLEGEPLVCLAPLFALIDTIW
uniref:Uncharacterized protein n=1 Tax=Plectus sambesii TaxID=2011161 RepID=A0A914VZ97_9BILA